MSDVVASYVEVLRVLAEGLALVLLVNGVDDVFIDVVYWVRRLWREITIYRVHDRLSVRDLTSMIERPFAIMVPAWRASGTVGKMVELAATTLEYEDYHVFVGTYPNDPETQHEVDRVCAQFRNVHKVVCARPGPTSKADCLNNIIDAILDFESAANTQFAGVILHGIGDVLSPMELRLFNYLVDRKDLIQLPVYPFERRWSDFTNGHYIDEFSEFYGKDLLVREAMAGQVPTAGVGTCFSRRALLELLIDGDGLAFDVQSLTENYDIGVRLRRKGLSEVFVRVPLRDGGDESVRESWRPRVHEASVVSVREYFPDTLSAAIRQKARRIASVAARGFSSRGWTGDVRLDYFLWRDRKSVVVTAVRFVATLVAVQACGVWAYDRYVGEGTYSQALIGSRWLWTLIAANVALFANRVAQRAYFVASCYGIAEGLLSVLRLGWGVFVDVCANGRALWQIVRGDAVPRIAWEEKSGEFPAAGEVTRAHRPLGQILVAQHAITEQQLSAALSHPRRGLKLGAALVHAAVINPQQLAWAVAEQSGVSWEAVDAFAIRREIRSLIPAGIALHYAVFPLREQGKTLVVASESSIDPVAIAALSRKLRRPVSYVIAPKGQVTVGLRHFYARTKTENARGLLEAAVLDGELSQASADALWAEYVSRQLLFADVLTSLGHLHVAALRSVLLRHERSALSLGDLLVREGIIAKPVLKEALALQASLQGSMRALCQRAGVNATSADLHARAV